MRLRVLLPIVVLTAVCVPEQRHSCHDATLEAAEPAAQLYIASPFVHGYRDGYQQGFHDVDVALQFAHSITTPESLKDYKKIEYRPEFGDKDSYQLGYRSGFLRGFADMRGGRDFRLFDIFDAAQSLEPTGTAVTTPAQFDAGVKSGYAAKREQTQLQKTKSSAGSTKHCPSTADAFCVGMRFGIALASSEEIQNAKR
jgi:hypothetical protein